MRQEIQDLKDTKVKGKTYKDDGELMGTLRHHYGYAMDGVLSRFYGKNYVKKTGTKKHPLYQITEMGVQEFKRLNP